MKFVINDKISFIFLLLFSINTTISKTKSSAFLESEVYNKKINDKYSLSKIAKTNFRNKLKDDNIENDNSCSHTCEICKGKICIKCIKGYFFNENKCLKLCPLNLIADLNSRKCIPLTESSKLNLFIRI